MGDNEQSPELTHQRVDLGALAVDVRSGGSGLGPPLVLVHGIGVSSDYFLPFARVIATERPVYLLDLPGYGSTPTPPRPLTVPELAHVVVRTLALLGVSDPVLVGQSMGCQIAVDAVAADPARYSGYILIGPTVDSAARGPLRMAARLVRDMLRETPANNAVVLRDYARMGTVRFLRTTRYMLKDQIEDKIAGCAVQGLVVRGSRDPIAPAAWARRLARHAPDAVTVEVAGAAHNVQHTHPEELAQACAPFLCRTALT